MLQRGDQLQGLVLHRARAQTLQSLVSGNDAAQGDGWGEKGKKENPLSLFSFKAQIGNIVLTQALAYRSHCYHGATGVAGVLYEQDK